LAGNHGELSWKDPAANLRHKKRKQLLADALKHFFHIDEDPFYPYRENKAYRLRFKIVPES
jgi:hypothetical protein